MTHVPGTTTGLLSNTSKMPSRSWSLPAGTSCPWAVTGIDTICGSCYAQKGSYAWTPVRKAQAARMAWTVTSMKTDADREIWIQTMVKAISNQRTKREYFRVHDSGDLFNANYVRAWTEVARRLPDVKFWIPTRSYRGPLLPLIQELAALPNVRVRASAIHFGDEAPVIDGLGAGSTASREGFNCPAHSQGNKCGSCRACWTSDEAISYRKH